MTGPSQDSTAPVWVLASARLLAVSCNCWKLVTAVCAAAPPQFSLSTCTCLTSWSAIPASTTPARVCAAPDSDTRPPSGRNENICCMSATESPLTEPAATGDCFTGHELPGIVPNPPPSTLVMMEFLFLARQDGDQLDASDPTLLAALAVVASASL